MTVEISRRLRVADRALKKLADSTIKKDPVRALVELITNSDDSYRRLEEKGEKVSGKIIIKVKRQRGHGVFRVVDEAEGFDEKLMDRSVGVYGEATSGFVDGRGVRGFFGRGLKEAILGMGYGEVRSIKNGRYYECSLNIEKYERQKSRKATQFYRDRLGTNKNGTEVTLITTRRGIRVPKFETLKRCLEMHYCLRDIMFSNKRKMLLVEEDRKGNIKSKESLSYKFPVGTRLHKEVIRLDSPYEEAEIYLEISRATEPLSGREEGYLRENGLLIGSRNAIHEISLFRFDENEYALRLYGRCVCEFLDTLIRKDETVISDNRDGLDWTHAFNKTLRSRVEKVIEKFVQDERQKAEAKRQLVESEKTRKRFKSTLKKINEEIVKRELGKVYGFGQGRDRGSAIPESGFDFIPNYVQIICGKKSTLTLKALPRVTPPGTRVSITSEEAEIVVKTKNIKMGTNIKSGVIVEHAYVEGRQVGAEGFVVAEAENGPKAIIIVKVVSKRKPPRETKEKKGLFSNITYDPEAEPSQRVRFDRETGAILIATQAPSVRMYLGLDAGGQEKLEARVLTAELVTQAVCNEIAIKKVESGKEPYLGEAGEAIRVVNNRLINKYASTIHESLIGRELFRELSS